MSHIQRGRRQEAALPNRVNVPVMQNFNGRSLEVTYLGLGAFGNHTWLLWNPAEPYYMGMVRQGKIGFTLEHRSAAGVQLLENVPLTRVRQALSR